MNTTRRNIACLARPSAKKNSAAGFQACSVVAADEVAAAVAIEVEAKTSARIARSDRKWREDEADPIRVIPSHKGT